MDGVKSEPRLGRDWGEEDEQTYVNECCSPVNRTEVTLDGRGGGDPILPGEVLLFWPVSKGHETEPRREEALIGKKTEDGRSACSTEDSGPETPGDSVEGKTPA
jgi:hypothetical protein